MAIRDKSRGAHEIFGNMAYVLRVTWLQNDNFQRSEIEHIFEHGKAHKGDPFILCSG